MAVYHTESAAETTGLGRKLAGRLRRGDVVAFFGDLGSGKTTMIKGIAAGLGVTETVKSPSFVIATQYEGSLPVYHLDLYRLGGTTELESVDLDDYMEGDGVCVIEWADRLAGRLPARALVVRLEVVGRGRRIMIEGSTARPFEPLQ